MKEKIEPRKRGGERSSNIGEETSWESSIRDPTLAGKADRVRKREREGKERRGGEVDERSTGGARPCEP